MFNNVRLAPAVRWRRHVHALALAVGMAGLFSLVVSDVNMTLTVGNAVAASSPAPGDLRPLTTGTAMDGFGAWSPDGRQVAFMRDGRLWLVNAGGDGARQLTTNAAVWDSGPAWRPDGKLIAFARTSMNGNSAWVMTIDQASGKESELLHEEQPIGYVAWGPKGDLLYYTTPQGLYQFQPVTKERRQVLGVQPEWEMLAGGLAISPDGKRAIFGAGPRTERGVRYDLWMAELSGEPRPSRLTEAGGMMPAFDARGRHIAYRNPHRAKQTGIYVMDLSTHQTRQVLSDGPGKMYFHPAISPDGKSLIVSRLLLEGGARGEGTRFTSQLYVHTLP